MAASIVDLRDVTLDVLRDRDARAQRGIARRSRRSGDRAADQRAGGAVT
jgi:hypothetical protein